MHLKHSFKFQPSLSMAIFPAEAPSCMVLAELSARNSDKPVTTDDDVASAAAAAAAHADEQVAPLTSDVLTHDLDNSAHVGMW